MLVFDSTMNYMYYGTDNDADYDDYALMMIRVSMKR